jgi:hypothetical protein
MVALMEDRRMTAVHILAIDLTKRSFQVCATDRGGAVLFNRVLSRARLQQLLNEQSPCIVAMEPAPPVISGVASRKAAVTMCG